MGNAQQHTPSLRIMAIISRHEQALAWAREQASASWGGIELASEPFDFVETDYYQASMGQELKKQFIVGRDPFDPGALAACKLQTNQWETAYATLARHAEPRPLNLDPGYLTQAKLVLASTKDHSHRIYLTDGIFAEVTLYIQAGRWQPREWTYPDYRRPDFQEFFSRARQLLIRRLQEDRRA